MILPVHRTLRAAIRHALATLYQLSAEEPATIVLEAPPSRAMGDAGSPVAFELARRLRKAPRAIAQEIVGAWPDTPGVAKVEAAPNGYLNVFLDRRAHLVAWLGAPSAPAPAAFAGVPPATPGKIIVEHTAINPNKAAHIGHLRNAVLGDTLVRLLRFTGAPVEVQNYIDNTGVQVADVVVGFMELERKSMAEVRALAEAPRFDYYCWDLYARVTEWYEGDKARLQTRAHALHAIEAGGNATAEMALLIAQHIVRCHLRTMGRLGIDYDLLTWEGHILQLQFWAHAFEILKAQGTVYLQTQGKLAGCWVMTIDEDPEASASTTMTSGTGLTSPGTEGDDGEDREKVIVRSNGTVTYVGKDIAYQFWKFGLLGRDFFYEPFGETLDGRTLWTTSATPPSQGAPPAAHPGFGRADHTYNVIDSRQSYLQKLLKQALATMGHAKEAANSTHFAYEMVTLTHKTARELGYEADASDKPFVEVSGRKGLGVKADDLLDRLIDKAQGEVASRNPDQSPEESRRVAEAIAVAAVRYFLIKFSRGKIIAFDIDEALSFEGESGPYLQYSTVRAMNVLNKLHTRDGIDEAALVSQWAALESTSLTRPTEGDDLWNLALEAARLDDAVDTSVRTLEPSVLAKYTFGLAQAFNAFYHRYQIANEPDATARLTRAAVLIYVRRQLAAALELMGASVPSRM